MLHFDRQKYLRILDSEGTEAALTALHRDVERWEFQTFEGEQGWQPRMFEELKAVRDFSRELWDLGLNRQFDQAEKARKP